MPTDSDITAFEASLRGRLLHPGHPDYDEARALYNAMVDKHPAVIVQCRNAADVIASVQFAHNHDLLIAIRGGGHNGPGLGSCDGGLVIDLRLMRSVQVHPDDATVTVEPGCSQGDMDHATHAFGLAVPAGIVSTTGVAGLTLGGGHGYLSRQYGLTVDHLLEADVVLADGSMVTASADQHPDLFWALRGGGGNFGVVVRFKFQARPVRIIYGGPVFWEVEHAKTIMQWYRDFLPSAPTRLCTFLGLKTVPPSAPFPQSIWNRKICALISCFNGSEAEAQAALAPMLKDLPEPLFQHMGAMPFPAIQSLFDPLLPPGLQWYWKGDFFNALSDEAIDIHLHHAANAPSALSLMHLYPIDGAVHDIKPEDTAWANRSATWSMVIAGIDADPAKADALKKWARAYWQALHPHSSGGAYINFMMEEGQERIEATYGDNHPRLRQIKRQYDPDNVFRVNQNIHPG
ncbi:FAD/FMN-containing dehydrogenase [Ferrimonas sediminum]|uniref:FAD/FMN-containing dehydrogenase n=1 Tax=Ferrimonas sediminum TaxID=718193 RepID=A0A1G8Y225_9GAMM|nr:FAD-binding oxidoreductase [Ferrimonas sediminum]SDJ96836.1 FAD/FMN-containing dehydrogenase [Ferrimonas sediminum]